MSKRYDWVDYAKGIGILLVVYAHTARGVFSAGIASDEDWYTLVDSVIYTFHMRTPAFFSTARCKSAAGVRWSRRKPTRFYILTSSGRCCRAPSS